MKPEEGRDLLKNAGRKRLKYSSSTSLLFVRIRLRKGGAGRRQKLTSLVRGLRSLKPDIPAQEATIPPSHTDGPSPPTWPGLAASLGFSGRRCFRRRSLPGKLLCSYGFLSGFLFSRCKALQGGALCTEGKGAARQNNNF